MSTEKAEKEKPEKTKPEKEIKISGKGDVEDLLKRVKAEKEKPITKKEKDKVKKRRGRPPKKKKPSFDLDQYSDHPISKSIDKFMLRLGDKILQIVKGQPLTKKEKLDPDDCFLGESICYTMDYYGLEICHPIIAIFIACGVFGWAVADKAIDLKEKKTKTVEK